MVNMISLVDIAVKNASSSSILSSPFLNTGCTAFNLLIDCFEELPAVTNPSSTLLAFQREPHQSLSFNFCLICG